MEKLIVIANLGRVRPVKFRKAGEDPREKAHLVEIPGSIVEMRPESIGDVVTDQAGRTTQSGPVDRRSGMSYGEEHNLKSELEKQALERIAAKIGEIVAAEGHPAWRLVVPQTILTTLVAALPAAARKALADTEAGDLTSLPLPELEKRFFKGMVTS
ncbi:MAG: host attachment protein [Verrucomicrobiota bacterium]